jgi:hypothetical protein
MNPSSSSIGIVVETTALPTYFTEWRAFCEANKLDCKLYEIARSTWRAERERATTRGGGGRESGVISI